MRVLTPDQRRSDDRQDVSSLALAESLPEKKRCDRGSEKPDKRKVNHSWRGMERCFERQPKLRSGTPRMGHGLSSGLLSVSRIAGLTTVQTTTTIIREGKPGTVLPY